MHIWMGEQDIHPGTHPPSSLSRIHIQRISTRTPPLAYTPKHTNTTQAHILFLSPCLTYCTRAKTNSAAAPGWRGTCGSTPTPPTAHSIRHTTAHHCRCSCPPPPLQRRLLQLGCVPVICGLFTCKHAIHRQPPFPHLTHHTHTLPAFRPSNNPLSHTYLHTPAAHTIPSLPLQTHPGGVGRAAHLVSMTLTTHTHSLTPPPPLHPSITTNTYIHKQPPSLVGSDVQPIWFRWDEELRLWEPFRPHECRRLERY